MPLGYRLPRVVSPASSFGRDRVGRHAIDLTWGGGLLTAWATAAALGCAGGTEPQEASPFTSSISSGSNQTDASTNGLPVEPPPSGGTTGEPTTKGSTSDGSSLTDATSTSGASTETSAAPGTDGTSDGTTTGATTATTTGTDGTTTTTGTTGTPPTSCGNGLREAKESCDGADLGGASCVSQGFTEGVLGCTSACTLNTAGCRKCGDGKRQPTEICDGTNLDGATCVDAGNFVSGTLRCDAACQIDTSLCVAPVCGDQRREALEACDVGAFAGKTCASETGGAKPLGALACAADCASIDVSGCRAQTCEDGFVDAPEVCDGTNLMGKSCASETSGAKRLGSLTCESCSFDTSACRAPVCGGATVSGGQCEAGDFRGLEGKTCLEMHPNGGFETGSNLSCTDSCTFSCPCTAGRKPLGASCADAKECCPTCLVSWDAAGVPSHQCLAYCLGGKCVRFTDSASQVKIPWNKQDYVLFP